jgi:hypothetical protein
MRHHGPDAPRTVARPGPLLAEATLTEIEEEKPPPTGPGPEPYVGPAQGGSGGPQPGPPRAASQRSTPDRIISIAKEPVKSAVTRPAISE